MAECEHIALAGEGCGERGGGKDCRNLFHKFYSIKIIKSDGSTSIIYLVLIRLQIAKIL